MKRNTLLWGLMFPFLFLMACGGKEKSQEAAESLQAETAHREESEDAGSFGIPIRIYHGGDSEGKLCVSVARTKEITPEILLLNLSLYHMVPDTTAVRSFEKKNQEDGLLLTLDLSGDFEEYLSGLDASEETAAMGSVVNTFLDAYHGSAVLIMAEGEPLNTGRSIYSVALEFYPYQEASYQLEEKELSEESIRISYPQIAGLSEGAIQEKWNEIIGGHAQRAFQEAEEGSSLEVSYTVKTMNDQLLSVLIEGLYSERDRAYPLRFCYTYNIDMNSGESLRLAYYRDTEELAEELLAGKGYRIDGEMGEEFQERLSILYGDAEQLADVLKNFDYGENRETPAGFSYQEDGEIHLCVEVPHALGDYVDVVLD